ncbi:transposase [Embleya sp. NPDC050154]|uniref:transposase n=1 Tax=unclassified Embleya TaxID=2699296 RepID=UPI0037897E7F
MLHFVENPTDRQAAHAVRARIDVEYLLGMELTDPGFDFTVLTGSRQRLPATACRSGCWTCSWSARPTRAWSAPEGGSAPTPLMSWRPSGA